MNRTLKLFHLGGLILFLGSVFTFIVISASFTDATLQGIAFGRQIISTGTKFLTIPGIWLITLSGIFMGYRKYSFKQRFVQVKLVLALLILLNTYFLIVPSAKEATELAVSSLVKGYLPLEYSDAYIKESIWGAVNVLLAIIAMVTGIWKWGVNKK